MTFTLTHCLTTDVVGRLDNDVDMIALEEELAALLLQDEGEPHPVTMYLLTYASIVGYCLSLISKLPTSSCCGALNKFNR